MIIDLVVLTKNRTRVDLYDWLQYHSKFKFNTIYVLDDDTTTCDVANVCEFFPNVIHKRVNTYVHNQIALYQLHYDSTNADWTLFIDDDEYLYLNNETADEFLSKYDVTNQIGLFEQVMSYKTGFEEHTRIDNMRLAMQYTPNESYNAFFKSFVPTALRGHFMNVHLVHTIYDVPLIDYSHNKLEHMTYYKNLKLEKYKIFHYYKRSISEFAEKVNNKDAISNKTYSVNKDISKIFAANCEYNLLDTTIAY